MLCYSYPFRQLLVVAWCYHVEVSAEDRAPVKTDLSAALARSQGRGVLRSSECASVLCLFFLTLASKRKTRQRPAVGMYGYRKKKDNNRSLPNPYLSG